MTKILYISLNGMTEPLGESQVVQYLLKLSKSHSIYLLSFEKPCDTKKHDHMAQKIKEANIEWKYFIYSNRFGVFSTVWQLMMAFFLLSRWSYREKIKIVHARSLIPAVLGVLLKKTQKIKFLFDIRGFAIDEKIIDGRLKADSLLTRVLKKMEAFVYKQADHLVTLTHASVPIIKDFYQVPTEKITVIPTCANIELFKKLDRTERVRLRTALGYSPQDFVILHNGSLNGWVDFDAELKLFKALSLYKPDAKFLFLNQNQQAFIEEKIEAYQLKKANCKIYAADFAEVHHFLNISDVCVFFIKPSLAKQASAPTKFAELIACHLFSVTNTNYGDMEFYLNNYPLGLLLELKAVHDNPQQAALKLIEFFDNACHTSPKVEKSFDQLFNEHFSNQIAINRYNCVYASLVKEHG
ncbi:MAG: glycosyltransferase [Gammaproteobacteria bacterium]|nr:glycosyltransferase [Gammaproteobacteria bacterium]